MHGSQVVLSKSATPCCRLPATPFPPRPIATSYSKQIKTEKPAICEKAAPFAFEAENDIAVAASTVTWLLAIVDVNVDVDVADISHIHSFVRLYLKYAMY